MKKSIQTALSLVVLVALCACSGKRAVQHRQLPKIVPDTLMLTNDRGIVNVNFSVLVPAKSIRRTQQMVLTPVLVSGNNMLKMQNIVVNSTTYANQSMYNIPRKMVRKGGIISYSESFPFSPWMTQSALLVRGTIGQHNRTQLVLEKKIADGVYSTQQQKPCVVIVPIQTAPVTVSEMGVMKLNYLIGSARIMPDFDNNARQLAEMEALLNRIVADSVNCKITSIDIHAQSSPDGSYDNNYALAKERALNLKNYIARHIGAKVPMMNINVTWAVAPWSAIMPLVEQSSLSAESKSRIARIVDSATNSAECERRLIALPAEYNYLKKNVLPQLRLATYKVNYLVREL